jgi:hypothetical protein
MAKKFSDEQMREIHSQYYTDRGLVKRDEATGRLKKEGLRAIRSSVTDDIVKENRYFFDVLEMDHDCIRLNFTKYKDCGCRYFLLDRQDLERLEKFIHNFLSDKI